MPNRLTRVPVGPVPPPRGLVRLVIPLADLFMLGMISRPPSGSLATTWVTPATLQLCVALTVLGIPIAIALAVLGGLAGLLGGLVLLLLALGSAAVAVVGIGQRLA